MPRYKDSWKAADVLCPFFIGEDGKSLICEGFEAGTKLRMEFSRTADKSKYMGVHCAGRYESCVVYELAMEKYR